MRLLVWFVCVYDDCYGWFVVIVVSIIYFVGYDYY